MRFIVGVELAIPVVDRLVLLQEDLDDSVRQLNGEARWTPAEQIRLNLKIFEDLDAAALPRIRELLAAFCRALRPFSFETAGTRGFPDDTHPRLILTDAQDEGNVLVALREHLERASELIGFSQDSRPWEPAVLIGRVLTPGAPADFRGLLNAYRETRYGPSACRELVLYRSEVVGRRARVRTVDRFALGSGE